jgi:sec-independent protein translocase protein TatA
MGGFSLIHWIILIIVILLLFGGNRFSAMMGDVAKGLKSFKQGMADDESSAARRRSSARSPSIERRSTSRRARAAPIRPRRRRRPTAPPLAARQPPHVRRRHDRTADRRDCGAALHRPQGAAAAMRTVGRWVGKVRGMARHFTAGIENMMREAELEEMEKQVARGE